MIYKIYMISDKTVTKRQSFKALISDFKKMRFAFILQISDFFLSFILTPEF